MTRPLKTLSVLSSLLLLAAAATWVHSRIAETTLHYTPRLRADGGVVQWVVRTGPGSVRVERKRVTSRVGPVRMRTSSQDNRGRPVWPNMWDENPPRFLLESVRYPSPDDPWATRTRLLGGPRARERVFDARSWEGLGFAWAQDRRVGSTGVVSLQRHALTFPLWLPAAVATIAPAVTTVRLRRLKRRRRRGHCPSCGYDLRASGGRCPECGALVTPRDADAERPAGRPAPGAIGTSPGAAASDRA